MYLDPSHPLLTKSAEEVVDIFSTETQSIVDTMLQLAHVKRIDPKQGMVGLAAPQIGISKRIILVDVGIDESRKAYGEISPFINPKIIHRSEEQTVFYERCLSVDSRVAGLVSRSKTVIVTALNRLGNHIIQEFSGYTARIFQHEIDHLDGNRFPDRVGEDGLLHWIEPDQLANYRIHWQEWPLRCPWSMWLSMKKPS